MKRNSIIRVGVNILVRPAWPDLVGYDGKQLQPGKLEERERK